MKRGLTFLYAIGFAAAMPAAAFPQGYPKVSFDSLYRFVSVSKKDEFETSSAFAKRAARAIDTGVVAIPLDSSAVPAIEYDADKGLFTIYLPSFGVRASATSMDRFESITVHEEEKTIGTHEASNAFGAKAIVTDKLGMRWVVATSNRPKYSSTPAIKFRESPDAARALRPYLHIYAVGTVGPNSAGSVTSEDVTGFTATISTPISLATQIHVLWMETLDILVVDERTGGVVAKLTVGCRNHSDFACK